MKLDPSDVGAVSLALAYPEDRDEQARIDDMAAEARGFLCAQRWCGGVAGLWFGLGVGGVAAVLLAQVENRQSPDDDWLWVVVGDVPPAYLVIDDNRTPRAALAEYVRLMGEWADAASAGRPVGKLVPVNVPATPGNARRLRQRLDMLRSMFLDGG